MKRLLKSILTAIALFSFSVNISFGEVYSDDFGKRMKKVKTLYEQSMYAAAQNEIESMKCDFSRMNPMDEAQLEGYNLLCSIFLEKPNMDALVIDYEEKYQNTPELAKAKFLQSTYYFRKGDYNKSMEIMNDLTYSFLSKDDKMEFLFNRSFIQLKCGDLTFARNGFSELCSMKRNKYTVPSTYYSGYIAYLNKEFRNAVSILNKIENDDNFGYLSRYYLLESHLMLKDYNYVINNGEEVYEFTADNMRPQVARIISEAYFETDHLEQAKTWLDEYMITGKDLSRKDNYYLGVISYSLHAYRDAINAFAQVVEENDSITQSAYYHTGNAYLNLKNKVDACTFFRKASEMPFDEDIREESFFNYAKLSFDVNKDIGIFMSYLENYPSSNRKDEIYAYIANEYLLTKKYGDAMAVLNKIEHPSPYISENFQKAAFFRGMELLNMGAYSDASSAFRMSLRQSSYNYSLKLLTEFWLAESEYRAGHVSEALKQNLSLYNNSKYKTAKEYPYLLFNIAYCYFHLKDYPSSIEFFNRFISNSSADMNLIIESKLRIADSYFVNKDYEKSSRIYEDVSHINYDVNTIVYAVYQCAISYGLLGDMDKKVDMLKTIYHRNENSPLYSSAVYELGRSYVETDSFDEAEKVFLYIIEQIKDPVYDSKSMLELGMLYSNQSRYDEALEMLNRIVQDPKMYQERSNALAVIESIYALRNEPEKYLAYIDELGLSQVKTEDERETMMFNAAEQLYLSENKNEAYKSLSKFIKDYPASEKLSQANFYLAETLSDLGRKEAAAEAYKTVMDIGEGSFVELSTLHFADICFDMEQWDNAETAYRELLSLARLENNVKLAKVGIMRSAFKAGHYLEAIDAANIILAEDFAKDEFELEAQYVLAKSCMVLGRRDEAMPVLKKMSELNMTPEGAEATYILITDAYDKGNFTDVENMVYAFSESNSNQTYWIAKSFIVLGDAFAEREDIDQAEATFKSIKDGYEPQKKKDDVLEQVEMRLKKIEELKKEEAQMEEAI